jgi:hypothetical protein
MLSHYSSSVQRRSRSHLPPGGDGNNLARNLEAEFNEVDIFSKTREAVIMATASYITANAPNDDEHMRQLPAMALKGVRVLQTTNEEGHDLAPRRNTATVEQPGRQLALPAVAPRPQVVEPINGDLRRGLAQHRVDTARAHREARRFNGEGEWETLDNNNGKLYGAECFSTFIRSTPLPKGIKISEGIAKFNVQQDPRIWLDDFLTTVTIGGGPRDNAL